MLNQQIRTSSYLSQLAPWMVVLVAALIYCADVLLRVAPGVLSNQLITHYNLNATSFSNLSAAYFYVYAPMQIPVGLLMDRYGPRHLLFFSALACALGTVLFVSTSIYSVAFMGRLFIGFGSAFAFVGILKLASMILPANRFAFVSGSAMALGMIGGLIGDQVLKHFISGNWQSFMINMACVIAVIGLIIYAISPNLSVSQHQKQKRGGLGAMLRDLLKLMRSKQLWCAALIACLMYTPLTLFAEFLGKSFIASSLAIPFERATNINDMIFVGWALGGLIVTSFSDAIQSRRIPIMIGSFISFVLSLFILYNQSISETMMYPLLIIFGIANSVQVLAFPIAKEITRTNLQATAMCFINMICMLSGNIQVLLGYLLDFFHSFSGGGSLMLADYQAAYAILPICMLLSTLIAYKMNETFPESH